MRVERLSLRLEPPSAGWMRIALGVGSESVAIDASYTPHDSLSALVDVALFLLDGAGGERTVTFNEEPRQLDVTFSVADGHERDANAAVRITRYRDHRRSISVPGDVVADARCGRRQVATEIARAMREVVSGVGVDAFLREWRTLLIGLAQLEQRLDVR